MFLVGEKFGHLLELSTHHDVGGFHCRILHIFGLNVPVIFDFPSFFNSKEVSAARRDDLFIRTKIKNSEKEPEIHGCSITSLWLALFSTDSNKLFTSNIKWYPSWFVTLLFTDLIKLVWLQITSYLIGLVFHTWRYNTERISWFQFIMLLQEPSIGFTGLSSA